MRWKQRVCNHCVDKWHTVNYIIITCVISFLILRLLTIPLISMYFLTTRIRTFTENKQAEISKTNMQRIIQSCHGRDLRKACENVCIHHSSEPVPSRQISAELWKRSSIVQERTFEWKGLCSIMSGSSTQRAQLAVQILYVFVLSSFMLAWAWDLLSWASVHLLVYFSCSFTIPRVLQIPPHHHLLPYPTVN